MSVLYFYIYFLYRHYVVIVINNIWWTIIISFIALNCVRNIILRYRIVYPETTMYICEKFLWLFTLNIYRSKRRWNRNEAQKTREKKSLKVCQFIFLHRVIYLMSQPKSLLLDPLSETLFSSPVKRNSRRIRQTISSFLSSKHSSYTCYQFFTRNKRVPSIPARRRVYSSRWYLSIFQ